jgi:tRNA threonylcarbamoyladenosine modification (KEOPS) complex Cgi121 subunit
LNKGGGGEEHINSIYHYGELKVLVKGYFLLDNNIKKLYDNLKSKHKNINIVIVNSNIVFGIEHIFGIMKVINEEMKRNEEREIRNFDIEFLLRICYTNQISNALEILNENKNNNFICILFSKYLSNVEHVYADLRKYGKEDNNLIQISEEKKLQILNLFFKKDLKDSDNWIIKDDHKFQKFLIERATIALK